MLLKDRIPNNFYKLFRTQNMEFYMQFLVAIYEENNADYMITGLTSDECKSIISETISRLHIAWTLEDIEESDTFVNAGSPSYILNRLVEWGWLKSDFDERINSYIISFPEYSHLYVELFQKLQNEDDSQERESMLSVYSALYTYKMDKEKNNDILKSALQTSKRLGQLLSNMQDGMRGYFDELSKKKNFIGIQEVLIDEINNSDSKRYAILTTTDSFYRYKEEVKEIISQILMENDERIYELERMKNKSENDSVQYKRREDAVRYCEESTNIVHQIEREFDLVERKYNHLVEQKSVFAKRALARIHYILQEDSFDGDNLVALINLLEKSEKKNEIVEKLQSSIILSKSFKNMSEDSIYVKKTKADSEFVPVTNQENNEEENGGISSFVPKPLYTKKELEQFIDKNTKDGVFVASESAINSVEDLEKLLFVWQDATNIREHGDKIDIQEELCSSEGFKFSKLVIRQINDNK